MNQMVITAVSMSMQCYRDILIAKIIQLSNEGHDVLDGFIHTIKFTYPVANARGTKYHLSPPSGTSP